MLAESKTYAVVIRRHVGNRNSYVVGRVLEVDLTIYVLPMRDERGHERVFGNKAEAWRYARGLGDVLPDLQEQDYMVPMSFAIQSEADAQARRAPLRALGYANPA